MIRSFISCANKVLLLLITLLFSYSGFTQNKNQLMEWSEFPNVPDEYGFNGAFVGVSNNALIVAGGANFPDEPVWDGGAKKWYDNIFVLEQGSKQWIADVGTKLPQAIGYGVSINTDNGIICIGGSNGDGVSKDVFRISWNSQDKKIEIEELPPLPVSLSAMSGDIVDNVIYLVGGQESVGGPATNNFLSLNLSKIDNERTWKRLDPFPGESRIMPVVIGQNNGKINRLFVFSGRNFSPTESRPHKFHSDVYSYNPHDNSWEQLSDIPSNGTPGIEGAFIGAAPAIRYGGSHILIFGGAGGENQPLYERMDVDTEIKKIRKELEGFSNDSVINIVQAKLDSLDSYNDRLIQNTTFSKKILSYHTITDTWVDMGEYTDTAQVVTKAIIWNDEVVIPMGEISPGVRTSKVLRGTFKPFENSFGFVNYATLGAYLTLIVGIGLYYSRKNNSTDDYFLGGNRVPWWAAGISIYATMLSAITYLSQPALAYSFDWQVYLGYFTVLAIAPFVVTFYIPYFRKLNIITAYEYLEARFDLSLRMFGSISFVLFQLARMGIVVYLPALALSTVMGMDIFLAIIIMGILSIIYTVMGGIEAVIWTDVLQVFVLILGLIIGLIYITIELGGDISHIYDVAIENDKLKMFDLRFSWTEIVTWSLLLGSFALNIAPYTTDQTVIQRFMTTKDEKDSAKSMWISAWMVIPAGILIFAMGTFLFVYFKENPELLVVGMETDRIFPLFIANQLPAGVAGLVIAGIFSASMSSLDSSMHSVSTVVTVDFYKRFNKKYTDTIAFSIAKWATIIVGILGTLIACLMAVYPVQSLFFLFQEIVGLFGSSLAGVFILGVFVKRSNAIGALIGALASILVLAYFKYYTEINFYIYPLIGIPSCVIIGYFVSILSKQVPKEV